jgi:tetratricopeptide (TPR) repeat protein
MMNTIPDREKAPALPLNIFAGIEEEFSAEGLFRWAVWLQSCGAIEEAIEYYGKALAAAPSTWWRLSTTSGYCATSKKNGRQP